MHEISCRPACKMACFLPITLKITFISCETLWNNVRKQIIEVYFRQASLNKNHIPYLHKNQNYIPNRISDSMQISVIIIKNNALN